MSEEIEFGLTIMAVGMITVFSILGLVILGGKVMILLINKFASEVPVSIANNIVNQTINTTKISVLASAVAIATKGKGKITKIEKL